MKRFWSRSAIPQGLGLWILCGWLIAMGVIPLLDLGSPALSLAMNITAIAAGILLLLRR